MGAALFLMRASAGQLPYAGGSFDHVVSSLMLHHLPTPLKAAMLQEAWRVLKPGGGLFVLDVGPFSVEWVARVAAGLFGRFEHVNDNLYGRVPGLLTQAGFVDVQVTDVAFGGLVKLYQGRRA